ncbi:MAG: NUDIX domain-containing protein [Oligoflexia bacterium]|nr:NUDIX domain-containing protein [Oligoflexia bacterium]
MNQLPLRPNVAMLVFNHEHKLWLGERMKERGIWQFPQGGIEPELSLEGNVLKELEEELGAPPSCFEIVRRLRSVHDYEFDRPPAYALGRWRGQSQTFYLVRFTGKDNDIDINKHDLEFMGWRWCSVAEVKELAEPKRLPGYLGPLKEFEDFLKEISSS